MTASDRKAKYPYFEEDTSVEVVNARMGADTCAEARPQRAVLVGQVGLHVGSSQEQGRFNRLDQQGGCQLSVAWRDGKTQFAAMQ